MKKALIIALLLAPMSMMAQKFGHFNSSELVQLLPEWTTAQTELQTLAKQYDDDLKRMQDELQKKADEFQKEQANLLENVRARREQELNDLYQRVMQSRDDNQQAFQKAQAEKMQPIQEKIMKAIENVAKAGGYVYIMEKGVGQPIYISDTLSKDVTADVKAELNKLK